MSLKEGWNKWEGVHLEVSRICNRLKKQDYEILKERPGFTTEAKNFRGAYVCIAIAKEITEDGDVVFLIRGQIPFGEATIWDGFIKHLDNKWSCLKGYNCNNLKELIVDLSPPLPGA